MLRCGVSNPLRIYPIYFRQATQKGLEELHIQIQEVEVCSDSIFGQSSLLILPSLLHYRVSSTNFSKRFCSPRHLRIVMDHSGRLSFGRLIGGKHKLSIANLSISLQVAIMSEQLVSRMVIELETVNFVPSIQYTLESFERSNDSALFQGGNIRFEEGRPSDSWSSLSF